METAETPHRPPGEILRDLRKVLAPEGARKLTQAGLAELLDYDDGYLQSMETGRRAVPVHLVDKLARLEDETRFPDHFARLLEELRSSVAAHRAAEAARPPVIGARPGDMPGTTRAVTEPVASKLEGKVDALRITVDGLSAKAEGRLDGLGGKLDRTEGTLTVLGNRLETTSAKTEVALGALGSEVVAASAKTEAVLGAVGGSIEEAAARTEEALGALGGKVDAASTRTDAHLKELTEKVVDTGDKVARTEGKVESTQEQVAQAEKKVTRKLDVAIQLLCANLGIGVVGLAAVFILHCQHAPNPLGSAIPGDAARVGATLPMGDGRSPLATGERSKGQPVPNQPVVKGQAHAPCRGVETPINSLCWIEVGRLKPPCPADTFVHGDRCYIPAAEGENQPSSETDGPVSPVPAAGPY